MQIIGPAGLFTAVLPQFYLSPKKDSQSPNSYLGQGITTITGLLMSMLFVNHITPGGHSAIEQSLLYILLFGGQQIPQHRH